MPSLVDRILGTWAAASGISLLFTFFKQYRARPRYAYLFFLGVWACLWGIQALRGPAAAAVMPRWAMWVVFLVGVAAMLKDSAGRYRDTRARLRAERIERLHGTTSKPPDDPSPG